MMMMIMKRERWCSVHFAQLLAFKLGQCLFYAVFSGAVFDPLINPLVCWVAVPPTISIHFFCMRTGRGVINRRIRRRGCPDFCVVLDWRPGFCYLKGETLRREHIQETLTAGQNKNKWSRHSDDYMNYMFMSYGILAFDRYCLLVAVAPCRRCLLLMCTSSCYS